MGAPLPEVLVVTRVVITLQYILKTSVAGKLGTNPPGKQKRRLPPKVSEAQTKSGSDASESPTSQVGFVVLVLHVCVCELSLSLTAAVPRGKNTLPATFQGHSVWSPSRLSIYLSPPSCGCPLVIGIKLRNFKMTL